MWLLSSICETIDSIVQNFIWQEKGIGARGWSLFKWDHFTHTKTLGGLGFHCARLSNIAMLGKLVWDFLKNPNKLWVPLLSDKYLASPSILQASSRNGDSYTWKSITKVVVALRDGLGFTLVRDMFPFDMTIGLIVAFFANWCLL